MSFTQRLKSSWAVLTASSSPTTPGAASSTTQGSTDPSTWGKFTQVAGLVGFLLVIAAVVFLKTHDITPLRAANDAIAINADASTEQARLAALRVVEQEKTKQEMMKRGLVPEGAQVAKVPEQPAPLSRSVVPLRTFDCPTEEEQSAGYAKRDIQTIGSSSGYQLASGCALVRIATKVYSLSGDNYLFFRDLGGSNYTGCGTLGMNDGVPRSPEDCINWLNSHLGQTVKFVTQNDGHVIINN
jgi:hypothetical protein